jgi:hypothetical protein
MHFTHKRSPVILAYFALLFLSLPVPLLHHCQTDRVIETLRPAFQNADGAYIAMLMPLHILALRWLGQLSWFGPFVVLALFMVSFWHEPLARFTTLCAVAICQCAFVTLYVTYAILLLGSELLHRGA